MRELKVLNGVHLKLSSSERKAFFEEELGEQVRSKVRRLLEEALEAERTDWLGWGDTCGTAKRSATQTFIGGERR